MILFKYFIRKLFSGRSGWLPTYWMDVENTNLAISFWLPNKLKSTDLLIQHVQYLLIFEKVCCKIISSSGTLNTDALTNKQIHTSKEHFLTLSSFWGCVYSKNIFVLSRSSRTNCIKTKLNRHWLDFLTTGDQKRHLCIFLSDWKEDKICLQKVK